MMLLPALPISRLFEAVADCVDVAGAHQDHLLDGALEVGGVEEIDGDAGMHRVDAARSCHALVDDIAGIIDKVVVVAAQSAHRVGTGSAIDHVVAGIADQQVVEAVAHCVDVAGARQDRPARWRP